MAVRVGRSLSILVNHGRNCCKIPVREASRQDSDGVRASIRSKNCLKKTKQNKTTKSTVVENPQTN